MELPAGAQVRLKVARKGKSALRPGVVIRAPDGSERTTAFALRERRKGALVSGRVRDLAQSGRWRIEISGTGDTLGPWSLKLTAKQTSRLRGDVAVPAGGDGEFPFDVFAGSRLKLTLRDVARGADPVLSAVVHAEEGAVALDGARRRLRGGKLSVSGLSSAATGGHVARVRLEGGGAGTIAVTLRAKAPRPRRMTLVHPGETLGGPLAIAATTLPSGEIGVPYAATVAATGGTPVYTFTSIAGALPDGLSLEPDGDIVGTPLAEEQAGFTVQVTDSAQPATTATRELTITVEAASSGAPEWRLLSPTGSAPSGRSSPGAVYDAVNDRMVVALGSTGSSGFPPVFSDTVALSLDSSPGWSTLTTGPSARWGHTLVLDSSRERALLYGGNVNGFQTNGEVWALDLSTSNGAWTQLSPTGTAPAARVAHTAVYDSDNDRMIVFAGGSGMVPGQNSRSDVWELSFSSGAAGVWTQRTPSGRPAAREFTAAVFDAANRRMVLFGGMTNAQQFADVWALDLRTAGAETWTQISPGGPAPAARDEHSVVYDSRRGAMIVFGGRVGQSDTNDAYALDLTAGAESWKKLAPTGTAPAARDSHAAVYDPVGRRMVGFSGFTGFPSTPFDDVWELLLP